MNLKSKDFSLNRQTLAEQVAEKLESMILLDSPDSAGKLPSEQTLAVTFSASRTVIREALVILQAKGLVVKSNGSCSRIVCNPDGNLKDALRRVIRLRKIQPLEIYEIRLALETLAVRLAAEKRTSGDLAELRKIAVSIDRIKDNADRRAGLDLDFHMKIIESSGNSLLSVLAETLFILLKPIISQAIEYAGFTDDATVLHTKIIRALEQKDAESAFDTMQTHLALSMRNFEFALKKIKNSKTENLPEEQTK